MKKNRTIVLISLLIAVVVSCTKERYTEIEDVYYSPQDVSLFDTIQKADSVSVLFYHNGNETLNLMLYDIAEDNIPKYFSGKYEIKGGTSSVGYVNQFNFRRDSDGFIKLYLNLYPQGNGNTSNATIELTLLNIDYSEDYSKIYQILFRNYTYSNIYIGYFENCLFSAYNN